MKAKKTKGRKDVGDTGYVYYKGYSVQSYENTPKKSDPHFVVPWELDHKDEKQNVVG